MAEGVERRQRRYGTAPRPKVRIVKAALKAVGRMAGCSDAREALCPWISNNIRTEKPDDLPTPSQPRVGKATQAGQGMRD